jgi:hypothetical protein
MNYRLLLAILATAIAALPALRAQAEDEDDDQEFDYFAYFTRAHNNLTFGIRATQGAKVKFGNLGTILPTTTVADFSADSTANNVARTYNNGAVGADSLRTAEINPPAGTVYSYISSVDGTHRYQTIGKEVDGNGVPFVVNGAQITYVTGDFRAYQAGASRNYGFEKASQLVNGNLLLTQYSVLTQGQGMEGKRNISGGVELQAERLFSEPSKRFRFGLVAGVSLNGINSKQLGTVKSTLRILTDSYSLNGGTLPTGAVFPYTAPDKQPGAFNDSNGTLISIGNAVEASPPLLIPTTNTGNRTVVDDPDGAEVSGVWQVKGSYLVLRVGPEFSASFTPNLSFNASAGFSAAIVGTNYSATEMVTLTDPTLVNPTISTGEVTSSTSKFLPGYYANLDASWAVNERTGFYAGLSYESYGDFNETLGGRTARVDLGGSASVRGGLNIKF